MTNKYVFIITVNGKEDVLITDKKQVTFNMKDKYILHGTNAIRIDNVTSVSYVRELEL